MSENFKGRSIFDVVAERRKRSRILSNLGSVAEDSTEEDKRGISESADKSVEEPETVSQPVQTPTRGDQPAEAVVAQEDEEKSEVDSALEGEELGEIEVSPLPQISSDIESLIDSKALEENGAVDSVLDEDSAEEVVQIESEGEVELESPDEESADDLAANLSLKEAASEIADEEIEASISKEVTEERTEGDAGDVSEAVEALDPIIDLSLLPKSQPSRILKKISKSGDAPGKKPKTSPTRTTASKPKKKSKRVTLLDSYFSDL